jgi:Cd2+/Zn2+-exporting ATPase/Cu+-exporting ATPase
MGERITLEVPIQGMDCADCTRHVQHAIASLPGVDSVEVFLGSEKAIIQHHLGEVDITAIRKAVAEAGYTVPEESSDQSLTPSPNAIARPILTLLGIIFGMVLFVVVIGEGLGLFSAITNRIPWLLSLAIIFLIGYPVFYKVARAAFKGQVIAHTLMTVGALAAILAGEWATAIVVTFFMRLGDYVEHFTAERARRAVKDLNYLAPRTARLLRTDAEVEVPIEQVSLGDIVIVRPGEIIPVDGVVLAGHAIVDQSTITGESLPVEVGRDSTVYAATLASLGSLQVRATHIGKDTTFGRVIRMVEDAEANRAEVQRVADKFSAYYLPVVLTVAGLTYFLSRDPLATVAVLVVACSCSFALATPIAMLASIGAAARHGLLIKGGKYLESLTQADILLIDKTGTLTLGKPRIMEIVDLRPQIKSMSPSLSTDDRLTIANNPSEILLLAASAERYSEHPLAEAVRQAARERHLILLEPESFEAFPGLGVKAQLNGKHMIVGNRRLLEMSSPAEVRQISLEMNALMNQGKSLLFVAIDGQLSGILSASDTLRPEVPQALADLRSLGVSHVELLTGDNPHSAAILADQLGIPYRADLLPEDKIKIVKEYQSRGHTVMMVGDGVNDAPALAQADIGIAMGAAGSGVALEAAHVALLRDDWRLIPDLLRIARRTLRVVKLNIGFTAAYNAIGLTLAAFGILPPVIAAAAQSLPDLGILANSSRLIRQK